MREYLLPLLLIAAGSLPGLLYPFASYALWRRGRVLEEADVRRWVRRGWYYEIVFTVVAVVVTIPLQGYDWMLVATGFIAAPALFGVLGVVVYAERQRLSQAQFPSPTRMRTISVENRQELRYVSTELANDLSRMFDAQEASGRGLAVGRTGNREIEDIDRIMQRLRATIQRTRELEARYGPHLKHLREVIEDEDYALFPLAAEQEAYVEELRGVQRDLDGAFDKLLDGAVELREVVNRVLQQVTYLAR
ncbi:MAG: hypothetical protein HYU66_04440 [Armatimonadetes bacterium]|nr:hypothetical protein [Armatimonadota bacterium]